MSIDTNEHFWTTAVINDSYTVAYPYKPYPESSIVYTDPPLVTFNDKEKNMESLWHVIAVTKDGDIIFDDKIVAEDAETAKFEFADEIKRELGRIALKLKDVTVLCNNLGSVKIREETRKVKVVDD